MDNSSSPCGRHYLCARREPDGGRLRGIDSKIDILYNDQTNENRVHIYRRVATKCVVCPPYEAVFLSLVWCVNMVHSRTLKNK